MGKEASSNDRVRFLLAKGSDVGEISGGNCEGGGSCEGGRSCEGGGACVGGGSCEGV